MADWQGLVAAAKTDGEEQVSVRQQRQDDLLLALIAADEAASDVFLTASSQGGTTLFHDGLPSGQVEVADG
jgi:hypothetical protein